MPRDDPVFDEPPAWQRARQRAFDDLELRLVDDACSLDVDTRSAVHSYNAGRRVVSHPGWLPPRPPRRMPAAHKVAEYWRDRGVFRVTAAPSCFRCGVPAELWNHLDRAHLVDRFLGGLDHAANLAMICTTCHKLMPMFEPESAQAAISWITHPDWLADLGIDANGYPR